MKLNKLWAQKVCSFWGESPLVWRIRWYLTQKKRKKFKIPNFSTISLMFSHLIWVLAVHQGGCFFSYSLSHLFRLQVGPRFPGNLFSRAGIQFTQELPDSLDFHEDNASTLKFLEQFDARVSKINSPLSPHTNICGVQSKGENAVICSHMETIQRWHRCLAPLLHPAPHFWRNDIFNPQHDRFC